MRPVWDRVDRGAIATTNSIRSTLVRRLAWAIAALSLGLPPVAAPADAAGATGGYGWPVKPFSTQHPVRGFFGDPRIGPTPKGITRTFHFGVDVACANGTAVYATTDGRVRLESFRPEVVAVVAGDGRTEIQYWHVKPAVASGQRVVAYRTVVGHVVAPWAHVHLAEVRDGRYVNPLRPGGLRPFVDGTRPWVRELRVEHDGRVLAGAVSGAFDLVVEAYDATPLPVPAPWTGKPVTPALLRWRLLGGAGRAAAPWRTAVDVRRTMPSNDLYASVYAHWTRQNKAHRVGRYRFYLAHGLDASRLPPGRYAVQVEAADVSGNTVRTTFPLRLGQAV